MTAPFADIARAAADDLSSEFGAGVKVDVELALGRWEQDQRPEKYVDPVSLGALIVSVAQLAWSVYVQLKEEKPDPAREVIVRAVRVKLPPPEGVNPEQHDRIIEIVVSQTLITSGDGD